MRVFGSLLVMLALCLMVGPAAQAQEHGPFDSVTFSEGFINVTLQEYMPPDAGLTNLYVDLQPGQIVISATVQGERGALDLSLTLAPAVVNGAVQMPATAMTLGGFEIDLTQFQAGSEGTQAVNGLQDMIAGATTGSPVETVSVTDTALTVTWRRADPGAPAVALVDTAVSLTISEAYANGLPGITQPDDPTLTGLQINFQPGQLVLTGTNTEPDGSQVPFSMTLVPTINGGLVTWSVTAMSVGGAAESAFHIGQRNDDIAGSWRAFFTGLYRTGQMTNVVLTDTSMTMTWEGLIENAPVFDLGAGSLVVTEEYINNAYQVTHPGGYRISDVVVDLQPGQVVITANLNLNDGRVLVEQATFVPSVQNGVIVWTITQVTLDGEALDAETIARFNEEAAAGWLSVLVWEQVSTNRITNVIVTDTEIEIRGVSR